MIRSGRPITVTYSRGEHPESTHDIHGVIVRGGTVIDAWGDIDARYFPRSAFKPFQALAVIQSGAADAHGLQPRHLALSMASHSGEPKHTEAVMAWLEAIGLDEAALHCGSHRPFAEAAGDDLIRPGQPFTARHHNCSGKHTGMLTLMRHRDLPADYETYEHPVQVAIRDIASRFMGCDLDQAPWGYDGCAVPNYAVTLTALATGYANLTTPPDGYGDAASRLLAAWAAHPDLVAGSNRFDTALMLATGSRVLSKQGAEGVQGALIPETGTAIVLKSADGSQRGTEQAMRTLIERLEDAPTIDAAVLSEHWPAASGNITNARGDVIGRVVVDIPN